MTKLTRYQDAYATLVIASYEPIIYTRWISLTRMRIVADLAATRALKGELSRGSPTSMLFAELREKSESMRKSERDEKRDQDRTAHTLDVSRMDAAEFKKLRVEALHVPGYPNAITAGGKIFLGGIQPGLRPTLGPQSGGRQGADGRRPVAGHLSKTMRIGGPSPEDLRHLRRELYDRLHDAAKRAIDRDFGLTSDLLRDALNVGSMSVTGFWGGIPEEVLSPIGIAHFFRQLYFNVEEGVGPIEEALTVAPLETLEVLYESTRRQTHEETLEVGSEHVSETAQEQKNLDEVSDKVSSMIQRDSSASMSFEGGAAVGVYNVSASASASLATSTQRSREESSRRMKEMTTRASERITKTFTVRTRDVQETTSRTMTRRIIRNESDNPVSYGLRRVLRKVRVKIQALGPKLVWQLYLQNPGAGLTKSRFVHFREVGEIAVPDIPPGLRPRPKGGTDTGTTSTTLIGETEYGPWWVPIVISPGPDRVVTSVSIDSIADTSGGGKDDREPSAINSEQTDPVWDNATKTFSTRIMVYPGDSGSVTVNYTYAWEPSAAVLDEWERERQKAVAEITDEKLQKQFEQDRALLTAKSKIRPRPANDLRREERFEVMNRMVSSLFARGASVTQPTPLEIESFHRFFDLDGMFITVHPAWWRPRYIAAGTFSEEAYPITAESEPAPLGSSLGWMLQLDGDTRRNEFLNSPWARVCIPVRPHVERAALMWLAQHVEGEVGYNPAQAPLSNLLREIETIRANQNSTGLDGPEWVTVDSDRIDPAAPADPASAEGCYPIVHEFDVTVPTDGFVYERLEIEGDE